MRKVLLDEGGVWMLMVLMVVVVVVRELCESWRRVTESCLDQRTES